MFNRKMNVHLTSATSFLSSNFHIPCEDQSALCIQICWWIQSFSTPLSLQSPHELIPGVLIFARQFFIFSYLVSLTVFKLSTAQQFSVKYIWTNSRIFLVPLLSTSHMNKVPYFTHLTSASIFGFDISLLWKKPKASVFHLYSYFLDITTYSSDLIPS